MRVMRGCVTSKRPAANPSADFSTDLGCSAASTNEDASLKTKECGGGVEHRDVVLDHGKPTEGYASFITGPSFSHVTTHHKSKETHAVSKKRDGPKPMVQISAHQ